MIQLKMHMVWIACAILALTVSGSAFSQNPPAPAHVPDAPASRLLAQAGAESTTTNSTSQTTTAPETQTEKSPSPNTKTQLTRSQAEKLAVKNNPQVTVARLVALAQHQVYRETRSAEMPTATVALTAVEAEDASRISAGSLTASRLFTHAGAGGGFSQLLTDFGKTRNLVASEALQEKAQKADAVATLLDIELATDQAFYNALQAQETLKVAQQNIKTRETLQSQVNQMTINKLKSTLDLSFADVSLSQAKLLALDAQNNADSTMASLDAVLGLDHQIVFDLVDDGPDAQQPPPDIDQLIQASLKQRPDLQASQFSEQAAAKFSHAQRDQMFPTVAVQVRSEAFRFDPLSTTPQIGGVVLE